MSCTPNALAGNDPAGAVCLLSHWLPQPPQLARFDPMALPQLYADDEPARDTYSHSASLSKRYSSPVCDDTQLT